MSIHVCANIAGVWARLLTINEVLVMVEEKEVDKEIPDGADELVTFSGGLYEFETSAGWHDHWNFPTRQ